MQNPAPDSVPGPTYTAPLTPGSKAETGGHWGPVLFPGNCVCPKAPILAN